MTISDVKPHRNDFDARVVAISFSNNKSAQRLANNFGAVALLDKMNLADELIPTIKKFACFS